MRKTTLHWNAGSLLRQCLFLQTLEQLALLRTRLATPVKLSIL